jgi:putative ABC transport system permease protein
MLSDQARTILAADVSAHAFHPFSTAELARLKTLKSEGVEYTLATDMVSMASVDDAANPLMVSLKAVDATQYPYYGTVKLQSGRSLREVLTGHNAAVSREFLMRMHAHLGDTLRLGNSQFRIVDVVQSEPDRISSSFGIGPRVMIARSALPSTGLISPGSRVSERVLFRLPRAENGQAPAMSIDALRKQVRACLPQADVTDYRDANPALTDGLRRATAMVTLVSLVTMVLSAIGVAMAMRAHLRQRMETIAILKTLGARSSGVMRIYGLQTLLLGIVGALLGIAAGAAVARLFPVFVGKLFVLPLQGRLEAEPVVAGMLTGILTTLLFTLPPLLEIRAFRPLRILRRDVERESDARGAKWLPRDRAQFIAIGVILLGLAAIAATLTQSTLVGGWFAGGLFAVLVFLLFASWGMLIGVRRLLARWRDRFPPATRQGLANLYRPGNQSAAVLTALSVGVMLIMTVFFVERSIVRDLNGTDSTGAPNVYLIDISPSELAGVKHLLESQPAIEGKIESLPAVSAQILSVDGTPSGKLDYPNVPKHLLRSTGLTWSDGLPAGETVVSGHWWDSRSASAGVRVPLAVSRHTAKELRLKVGSKIDFRAGQQRIEATVAALYKSDGQHIYGRSRFILPGGVLANQDVIWYAGFHAPPNRVAEVERAMFAAYPTVTVINMADVMDAIRRAVARIATILRFLAAFAMIAGGIILASSVMATRFERVRETAILKSLGAMRRHLVTVLSVEFLTIGGIAGIAGTLFALALAAILLDKLKTSFHPGWGYAIGAVIATGVLATAVGWLASIRTLRQKPLEVLREE